MTVAPYAVVGDGVLDHHYGFGFDPVNDDYKVVKFARMFRPPGFLTAGDCVFQNWMEVEVDRFPSNVTCVFDDAKVSITGSDGRDGRVHWLCCGGIRTKQIIVAFDLGVEKFSQFSLPDSVGKWRNGRANVLGFLGGKICVMGYDENGDFEVWVMGEYGVSESWVKDYAFSQFGGGIFPIGFTLNNEFVFQDDNKCLVLYDQNAAKVKSFNVTVSGGNRLRGDEISKARSLCCSIGSRSRGQIKAAGGSGRERRKRGGVGMLVDEDRTSLRSSLREDKVWGGPYQVQRDGEETRKETRCGEDHTL
ncbi:hypothetical protein QVD17_28285 [Tagetes erecta]|uniref:F-box associated beta-propeller type 3 domain-containing protein n=1 Tax=Tagetes erecta TaxID=13708 RepID=A0AAD8KET0_TARER|nr:hypothetical protein QVD17_28285 [Tagetes erecta]